DDLARRGMLENTMVLAFGEFGRTPKINPAGGRDHHPACWSVLFAGGPVQGGRVVGASDATGYAPKDRPVTTAEIAATVFHGLGSRVRGGGACDPAGVRHSGRPARVATVPRGASRGERLRGRSLGEGALLGGRRAGGPRRPGRDHVPGRRRLDDPDRLGRRPR